MAVDIAAVAKKMREWNGTHPGGCCLHISVEDGNMYDENIYFCIREAVKMGHRDCLEYATELASLSEYAREQAYEMSWE